MNSEQFTGQWLQFKGALKQLWGKLADDDVMQIEGRYEAYVGRAEKRYGDQKEETFKWLNNWNHRSKTSPRSGPRF